MNDASDSGLMTIPEAAPLLRISTRTLYRRVEHDQATELGGTHILGLPRVRRDLVEAMAAKVGTPEHARFMRGTHGQKEA